MGDQSKPASGHGGWDHAGEAADVAGVYANVLQAADQGSTLKSLSALQPGYLPGSQLTQYDAAGNFMPNPLGNESRALGNAFNGVGAVTSGLGAITGGNDALDPTKSTTDRVIGGGNFLSGMLGMVGSIAGMGETSLPILSGLSQAGGAAGMGANVFGGAAWGAGAAGGVGAGIGTALATGSSVLGAGLAGYGVGKYGDEHIGDTSLLADADGNNRSITDWSADQAVSFEQWVGGGMGETAGGIAGGAAALGLAVPGALLAAGSTVHGIGAGLGRGASSLYNWATGPDEP
jgi:hypothetical protein